LAIVLREFDLDDCIVSAIDDWRPTTALPPYRAPRLPLFPVNHEAAGVKSLPRPCLPSVIGSCGPQEFYPIRSLTGDQQFGIEVAGIHDV
jgi:hypothetical protein